ncbi:MAG TPA: circadian clock KaiB family protein [Solirubrobacteraceae bacterium]|nr:circadian clock KaiB family protein [Solirubrobacteraceae bacterium]
MPEDDATRRFERALADLDQRYFLLRLYVVGASPASQRAVVNLRAILTTELTGRYALEVIDVYQDPSRGASEQIVAAPTLVRELPLPVRKLVGDMSDRDRVLLGLDILPELP